jgi:3-oxoacyl-[acyl-carrier-protein] synthase II
MSRRVVITGLGTVNPTGNDVASSWANIKAGRHGIGAITAFDTADFEVKLAAEVKDFDPSIRISRKEAKRMARFTQFAYYAAEEAIAQAGLTSSRENPDPGIGVDISSGIGGLSVIEEEHDRGRERGYEKVSPFFIPETISNMAAAQIAIAHGFQGMCTCPVTACAGGSNAIGDAFHRIRDGYEDAFVAGGTEAAITVLGIGGFSSMKALTKAENPDRASIPFDAERSGFVMGEGAGVIVMEELEHAKARGARILAEITGYGANCDAYHITAPSPNGEGGAMCMQLALDDAKLSPDQIDYINAHGTSTHLNDAGETKAIHTVFGAHADKIAVSSTKSMTGHLLGGAGGVEAIFCVKALEDQFIPPTAGLTVPDPECDLDYVPGTGRSAELSFVLSNSLGFGGHNACLIFRHWEEA